MNKQCLPGNKPADSTCMTGFCDGNGACKQCGTMDSECTPMNTECKTFTCMSNACSENDKSNTTTARRAAASATDRQLRRLQRREQLRQRPLPHLPVQRPQLQLGETRRAKTPCPGGNVCDGADHCVQCVDNTECTAPQTCGGGGMANKCGCTATTCNALNQTCGSASDGCSGTLMCDNGMDGNETDVDCGGAASGPGNHCPTRCAKGKMCNAGSDCVATANNCVDGVCCNTACGAICQACNLSGTVGTCSPIAEGTNDAGKCDNGHGGCGGKCTCNGAGACLKQMGETCTLPADCASNMCNSGTCG